MKLPRGEKLNQSLMQMKEGSKQYEQQKKRLEAQKQGKSMKAKR